MSDTPKSIKIEQKALSAKQICEHKPRPSRGGGWWVGGGSPLFKLCAYVPLSRVWFSGIGYRNQTALVKKRV